MPLCPHAPMPPCFPFPTSALCRSVVALGCHVFPSVHSSSCPCVCTSCWPSCLVPSRSSVGPGPVGDAVSVTWSFPSSQTINASPAISNGVLFTGSDGMHAVNVSTGQPLWSFPLPGACMHAYLPLSLPFMLRVARASAGGAVCACLDYTLTCLHSLLSALSYLQASAQTRAQLLVLAW